MVHGCWSARKGYGVSSFLCEKLAGLHEFPTVPNVSGAAATSENAPEIVNKLLPSLLVHPPSPWRKGSQPKSMGGTTSDIVRIMTMKAVGDVVHVFSRIKKTYCVQWVILEGGEDESPELHEEPHLSPVPTPKSD